MCRVFIITKNHKKGFALPTVIVTTLLLLLISTAALQSLSIFHYIIRQDYINTQLYLTAVSGVEYVLSILNKPREDMLNVSEVINLINREIRFPSQNSPFYFIITYFNDRQPDTNKLKEGIIRAYYNFGTTQKFYEIKAQYVLTTDDMNNKIWIIWRLDYHG